MKESWLTGQLIISKLPPDLPIMIGTYLDVARTRRIICQQLTSAFYSSLTLTIYLFYFI